MVATSGPAIPRPSALAVLLLVLGVLATTATSPPSTSASTSGTAVLDADTPVLILAVDVIAPDTRVSPIGFDLAWDAAAEAAVEPVLSIVTIGTSAVGDGPSFTDLSSPDDHGVIELALVNPAEAGPVTIDWNVSTWIDGDGEELDIKVNAVESTRPAGAGTLPVESPRRPPNLTVFTVRAETEGASPDDGLTIGVENSEGGSVMALLDDGWVELSVGPNRVPWPASCGAGPCQALIELTVVGSATISAESGDGGSVTAVGRAPAEAVAWLALPPSRVTTGPVSFAVEVDLPASRDPLAGWVFLAARIGRGGDQAIASANCFVPVDYGRDGGTEELTPFVTSGDRQGQLLLLDPGRRSAIDIVAGTDDPGQHCDADPDAQSVIEIGIVTYGVDEPAPAGIRLS